MCLYVAVDKLDKTKIAPKIVNYVSMFLPFQPNYVSVLMYVCIHFWQHFWMFGVYYSVKHVTETYMFFISCLRIVAMVTLK